MKPKRRESSDPTTSCSFAADETAHPSALDDGCTCHSHLHGRRRNRLFDGLGRREPREDSITGIAVDLAWRNGRVRVRLGLYTLAVG